MCGIAGIALFQPRDGLGQTGAAMLERLRHRGPDDHGWLVYCRDGLRAGQGRPDDGPAEVMLLHRRLSILDLSAAGRQPMSSPDGRYHIVYSGEIYNHVELREELAQAGFTFRSRTDTEVLLAALAHWGPQVLPRLVGMFAFALLDTQARTLLLARDFFGIKPLFYASTPDRFAFASEIKGLLELPDIQRRINPWSLYDYLYCGLTDHSPHTLLASIRQIPPGHFLQVPLDVPVDPAPQQYWRIDLGPAVDLSFEEAARRLRELFLESVRLHLRSDVPIGTTLSGGIDSTSVIMAVREIAGRQADFHSFSFIAGDSAIDEEYWVDLATSAAGTTVHKVRINPDELVADLDDLIVAQDEPFGSTSIYAQYRLFRLAHQAGVKVLLDGQGGDELLAGYRAYLPSRMISLLREGHFAEAIAFARGASQQPGVRARSLLGATCLSLLPLQLERWVRRFVPRGMVANWINQTWFAQQGVTTTPPGDPAAQRSLRSLLLETLSSTSLPMLLRFEDRNSMAFSIESRVPFLTPQITQFVLSLPEAYLISADGTSKHVFRAAMRGIVPDAILDRRDKIGFSTPEVSWLRSLRPWVNRTLRSDAARSIPALHYDTMLRQTEAILSGRQRFDWRLWRWLNLLRWSEHFQVEF